MASLCLASLPLPPQFWLVVPWAIPTLLVEQFVSLSHPVQFPQTDYIVPVMSAISKFARKLIRHYTSVDFEDTAERRILRLFVVRAQTLWSQRQCGDDCEMHDSGVSIMQDGELVES